MCDVLLKDLAACTNLGEETTSAQPVAQHLVATMGALRWAYHAFCDMPCVVWSLFAVWSYGCFCHQEDTQASCKNVACVCMVYLTGRGAWKRQGEWPGGSGPVQ